MRTRPILAGLVLAVAAAGCGEDDPVVPVFDPDIVELKIRPATPIVAAGRRIQLVAEAHAADGYSYDQNAVVTWEVEDSGILTVTEIGIAQGVAAGTTTVTATHPDGPAAEVEVQVLAGDVASVRVDPPAPAVVVGDTLQLTATAILQDESEQDVTDQANWACSNLAAATVNNDTEKGLVTGVEPGQGTFAATFLGVRGGTSFTITLDGGEEQ